MTRRRVSGRGLLCVLVGALITVVLAIPVSASAQAVTTATVMGRVVGADGAPIQNAQVTILNTATGIQRTTVTRADGRFLVPGLRPGGPYRVEAEMIGRADAVVEDLRLSLGETQELTLVLSERAVELEGIAVTATRGGDFVETAGVAKVLDEAEIESSPSLSRDLADFVRFTPQAYVENDDDDGPAISIAGQNNRYNTIYIDGAVSNDVFGLSAQGVNGGQTGATPISMEAIEQIQIAISPFNVTQSGFTGGAINAVTRSGTNQFEGSAFYEHRNASLAGKTPTAEPDFERTRLPDFTTWRTGFRFGGPIVQDKAFFFVNGEILRSATPQPFNVAYEGNSADRLDELRQFLIDEVGYDPGTFADKQGTLDNEKILAKFDWEINDNHRVNAQYRYSHSENLDAFRSGATQINYSNNAEVFPNDTHNGTIELNSRFGDAFSNKLILGYTSVLDDRDYDGEPFPTITIRDGAGEIRLGAEPFSTANLLDQDILTLTNNFNWFLGEHTLTAGAHLEYYDIANLFIPFNFGWYFFFGGMDDFMQAVRTGEAPFATGVLRGYSLVGDESAFGDESENIGAFNAYQAGVYLQDRWQVSDRLDLTYGVRVDVPEITTKPRFAPDVFDTTIPAILDHYALNGARPGETPDPQPYFQPRFGFEYDLQEDRSSKLRGGAGVFMGRVPFVWPGSMFLNNGANTGIVAKFFTGGIPFRPDPQNGVTAEDFGADTPIPSGRLEIFEEGFRYPTVFRTSLGLDHQFGNSIVATLEGQYTNTLNNILVTNVNLDPTCLRNLDGPDTRQFYGCDFRRGRIDVSSNQIDSRYTNIQRVGSTGEGYTYDITAALDIPVREQLRAFASYTYGDAFAVNDGTSSQVNSLWQYPATVGGGNNLQLARSDFSIGHRVLGRVTWREEYLGNLGTSITLSYIGESGRPFSYIIGDSEDMMGMPDADDAELFYIPENASDLTFAPIEDRDGNVILTAAEQAAQLEEFISGVEYLNSRRGQYAERNGDRTPFEHVIDLRLAQQFLFDALGVQNRGEVYLNVFNFSNLLNEEWGRRYIGIFTHDVLQFEGFQDPDSGDYTPVYQYHRDELDGYDDMFNRLISDFGTYSARWQMQLGVRYSF